MSSVCAMSLFATSLPDAASPKTTRAGSPRVVSVRATFWTLGSQVAVKSMVWRSEGHVATIDRIWGSKPMSSMRSASSSTRISSSLRSTLRASMRSLSRPGVATTTPREWSARSALTCWYLGAPP